MENAMHRILVTVNDWLAVITKRVFVVCVVVSLKYDMNDTWQP